MKKLEEKFLIQINIEKGKAVIGNKAEIFYIEDLNTWNKIEQFTKDIFLMPYLKNGIISFSEGRQSLNEFYIFGEGLRKIDGKVFKYSIEKK